MLLFKNGFVTVGILSGPNCRRYSCYENLGMYCINFNRCDFRSKMSFASYMSVLWFHIKEQKDCRINGDGARGGWSLQSADWQLTRENAFDRERLVFGVDDVIVLINIL